MKERERERPTCSVGLYVREVYVCEIERERERERVHSVEVPVTNRIFCDVEDREVERPTCSVGLYVRERDRVHSVEVQKQLRCVQHRTRLQ